MRKGALFFSCALLAMGCGKSAEGRKLPPHKLDALRDLVTKGGGFGGAGIDHAPSLEAVDAINQAELKRLLNEPEGLHKATRYVAERAPGAELMMTLDAGNGVALEKVRELLGKEDHSEQGTGRMAAVTTVYHFGWVRLAPR